MEYQRAARAGVHSNKNLVPHMGSFPMAIKVEKRALKMDKPLEMYVSEIIKTKDGLRKGHPMDRPK